MKSRYCWPAGALCSARFGLIFATLFIDEGRVQYDNNTSPEERAVLHRASTLARRSLGLAVKCWPCFASGDPCTCDDSMSAEASSVCQSTALVHTSNPMTMTPPS
jgi:hypothetical protein